MVNLLRNKPNVEFILDTVITGLKEENKSLTGLNLLNKADNKESVLPVDGLFVSIGRVPDTEFVKGLINLDDGGYIIANENCETNIKGIFVAGDCRTKTVRQLTTATADGTISAMKAVNYLDE